MNASHFSPPLLCTSSDTVPTIHFTWPWLFSGLEKKKKTRSSWTKQGQSQAHQHQVSLKLVIQEQNNKFIWKCQQNHFVVKGSSTFGDPQQEKPLSIRGLSANCNTVLLPWWLQWY